MKLRQSPVMPFLSYLDVRCVPHFGKQDFVLPMGRPTYALCLILRGTVHIRTQTGMLEARAGDLVFWPKGVPYESHWFPDPDGPGFYEFSAVYFRLRGYRTTPSGSCRSQNLPCCRQFVILPGASCKGLFRKMEKLFLCTGRSAELLSAFYRLWGLVLPFLPAEKPFTPMIQKVKEYIEANRSRDYALSEVAEACGLSESRLYHLFREETGISLMTCKVQARLQLAAEMLLENDSTVEAVSASLGYSSPAYFCRLFRKHMGMTPTEYRASGGNIG